MRRRGCRPLTPSEWLELADGDVLDLRIGPVAKHLGDATVRMLAYNGSVPGPVLRVQQHSTLVVNVFNEGDLEDTVHWHGLRLDNRFDGTHETQAPIPIGGRFTYRIEFPDPGVYWYHPHIREDYGQEMGLYGNIVVAPADPDYWSPVHRELALVLDDVLIEDGRIAPFSKTETNYVAMGRFGNVLLLNGEPDLSLGAKQGEVVRLYLTNTANTRVFNVGIPGARMKRVGGDSGHYEREEFVDGLILAPSERAVVDVCFDETGELTLEHRTPDRTYPLAMIRVADEQVEPSLTPQFEALRTSADMLAERARIAAHLEADPDKTLAFVAEMDMGEPELPPGATLAYACPMHPEVIGDVPGRCPKCGMALLATATVPIAYACPMHPEVRADQPERCPECGMFDLQVNGTTKADDVGDGGTTGSVNVAVGSNPTVGELAGAGTTLADYASSIECTGDSSASSSDSGPLSVGMLAAGDVVDCTITNTRKPRVTVTKDLVPSGDGGLFDLQVNGATKADDVGDAGTTGSVNVPVGSNPTVGEVAGAGTNLNDYESSIACTGDSSASSSDSGPLSLGTLAAGDVVDCMITNTRKPRVKVTKDLVPSTDGGLFDLQVNGTTQADDVGDAGTTGYVNVPVGSNPTVGELAGAGPTWTITSPRSPALATAARRRLTPVRSRSARWPPATWWTARSRIRASRV